MKQRLLIVDRAAGLCELYGKFHAEIGYDVKTVDLDDLANILRLLAHRVSADLRPSGRVCRR